MLRREERGFAKKKGKAGGDEGSDVAEIDVGGLLQVRSPRLPTAPGRSFSSYALYTW